MNEVAMDAREAKYRAWYYWWRFPLLPIYRKREANYQNTVSYSLNWLGFHIWTIDSFHFRVEIGLEEDLSFRVQLPWLIIRFAIPVFPIHLLQRHLWRQSQWSKDIYARKDPA